mgnify:CR=1 FL=1
MSELQTMSLIPSHVLATVHLSVLVGSLQNSNNTVSALSILTVGVDSTFSLSTSTMATDRPIGIKC